MSWFEGEVGYVWLELWVNGNRYLVGSHTSADENSFQKLVTDAQTDEALYSALDQVSDEGCMCSRGDYLPCVSPDDDGVWKIELDSEDEELVPLKLSHIIRAFFTYLCCDEGWSSSYNYETGKEDDPADMADHPLEKLYGNDLRWLMEYCSD